MQEIIKTTNQNEPDQELTVTQVAKILGITESAVYKNKRLKRNPMNTDGITFFLSDINAYKKNSTDHKDALSAKFDSLAATNRKLEYKVTTLENDIRFLKSQLIEAHEILKKVAETPMRIDSMHSRVKDIEKLPEIQEALRIHASQTKTIYEE